ncbi:MAG: thioredoxin family protein [Candidatus Bathyarchaeia archaeon]
MLTIPEEEKKFVLDLFSRNLVGNVRVVVFTREHDCLKCQDAVDLVNETAKLSDKIEVLTLDVAKDKEALGDLQIDLLPAVAVLGEEESRIFYYGVPSGYVYRAFVDDIVYISKRATSLTDEAKARLERVRKPVHIRVLVTLNCQYCPGVLKSAHQLALENPKISTDVIDIDEFPDVGRRYAVVATPKIIINETVQLVGVPTEQALIDRVLEAMK